MKTQVKNIKLAILALLLICPTSAFAMPQNVDLEFAKLTPSGDLKVVAKFDEATERKCKISARVKLYNENQQVNDSEVISGTVITKRLKKGLKKIVLKASDLPGAKKSEENEPIMAMQVRLKCGEEIVYSDVEARYIICGEGSKRVSLIRYFTSLDDNIR